MGTQQDQQELQRLSYRARHKERQAKTNRKREGKTKTDWTGLKLGDAFRKAENRKKKRNVVARSSLALQRSSRLRDK